ncbi:phage head closure protein [Lysinibacillus sp. SGAir0095]|uniref:phage head closure protein n=1 Tax=Lysinibacillus sp. SGAir0095 TaxID=2070463 RepID=UPI0010CD4EC6|nr:phage head closure protein [Lysinibacillus sp. SGAir0095]QCR33128.1 phage head-tail adapter protein [Lysinibacillus sp. SGAir0095]
MYFSPFEEFPHKLELLKQQSTPDGSGGSKKEWVATSIFNGFMDTPSTKERLYAMQMSVTYDRFLYYPYGQEIASTVRVRFENVDYVVAGEGEDQGGQHEVMRIPLKKVT